jgi:hypothetical protein
MKFLPLAQTLFQQNLRHLMIDLLQKSDTHPRRHRRGLYLHHHHRQ